MTALAATAVQHLAELSVQVQLLVDHHVLVGAAVLGTEGLLVGDVVVLLGLARVLQVVDDHVVVQHLGLIHGVDGVELVLPLGLGVRPPLLQEVAPLATHNKPDSGQNYADHRDQDAGNQA